MAWNWESMKSLGPQDIFVLLQITLFSRNCTDAYLLSSNTLLRHEPRLEDHLNQYLHRHRSLRLSSWLSFCQGGILTWMALTTAVQSLQVSAPASATKTEENSKTLCWSFYCLIIFVFIILVISRRPCADNFTFHATRTPSYMNRMIHHCQHWDDGLPSSWMEDWVEFTYGRK